MYTIVRCLKSSIYSADHELHIFLIFRAEFYRILTIDSLDTREQQEHDFIFLKKKKC